MQITDPIADLLTRIRNASTAKHPSVEIPASNMKKLSARFWLTRATSRVCRSRTIPFRAPSLSP